MDLLGAIPGIIGAIAGIGANDKAAKASASASKSAKKLADKKVSLFDLIQSMVQQADAGGQFNPEQYISQLENDTAKYEARDAGNLAGALRVAGYKPGDSEIGRRLDAVKMNYRQQLDQQRTALRRGLFSDRMNAYQAINPDNLNSGIALAQNNAAMAQSQMQNPAGLFASIMPFLQSEKPDPKKQLASSLASGFRFMS